MNTETKTMNRAAALDAIFKLSPWADRWFATSGHEDVLGVCLGWTTKHAGGPSMEKSFHAADYAAALRMAMEWLAAVVTEVA